MKEEIQKAYRQEDKFKKSKASLIGSSLVIMATILPCIDRILCWIWPSLDSLTDSRGVVLSINIWQGCLYASSVLLAASAFFKPNFKLYYYPIAINAYSSIVYFSPIFGYKIKFLQLNSLLAGVVSLIISYPIFYMLKHVRLLTLQEKATDDFQADLIHEIKKLNSENKKLKSDLNSQNN